MGPIELLRVFVLPAELILVGAGVVIVRRQDARLKWTVGVLLWTVAALLLVYVATAILSRKL